jgi:hypothetical protein
MYALIKDGAVVTYPYSVSLFRQANSNISLPEEPTAGQLAQVGLFDVYMVLPPVADPVNEVVEEVTPKFVNGRWQQAYKIRPATGQEAVANLAKVTTVFKKEARAYLDEFAQTRNYDDITSAATYATSTVAIYQQEGQYAVKARDQVWQAVYQILDDYSQGVITTLPNVRSILPELIWPTVETTQG